MNRTLCALVMVAVVLMWSGLACAQQKPEVGEGSKVVLTWDEFVKITGFNPNQPGQQVLTIPWSEVETLLGVKVERVGKGSTVSLPWQEFKALLEWSVKKDQKVTTTPPPADYLVNSCEYTGVLTDDAGEFTLTMKVDVLRQDGWKHIPILPAGVAITKKTLDPGVYLNATDRVYEVLTEKTGPLTIVCQFSVAVEKAAGINRVSFERVSPGSSVVDLQVDRTDIDVKVAGSQKMVSKAVDNVTHWVAALPSGVPMSVTWERALPKVAPVPAKLYAETRTLVAVAEGISLCQETVDFNILHTAVRELKLTAPKGVSVLTVTGNGVQDWRLSDAGELSVQLRSEVIGAFELSISYEQLAKDDLEIPVIRAQGMERERGYISVVALANVEIESGEVTGARAIDVRQLPSDMLGMTNQPILLAFRYVEPTFRIPLVIKKHGELAVLVTIVDSELLTGMQLNDGRRITRALFSVRNNRNQFLRLEMPKGAEIWSVAVSGKPVTPARDKDEKVLIPLVRSSGVSELASFPVEVVYVETPEGKVTESGTFKVNLPGCDVPIMHVMYDYYAPAEGYYERTWSWNTHGFKGELRTVKDFTRTSTTTRGMVDAAQQMQEMQAQFDTQMNKAVVAGGATPMKVELPVTGKNYKLERILVLPKDRLWFEVGYSGWVSAAK